MKRRTSLVAKSLLCATLALSCTVSYGNLTASAASYDYEDEELSSDASVQKVEVFGVTATKVDEYTYTCTLNEGDHLTDVYPYDFWLTTTDDMAEFSVSFNQTTGVGVATVTAEDGTKAVYTIYVKEA